jgi:pimeloyl-ACP methyl ester carboxylesterase
VTRRQGKAAAADRQVGGDAALRLRDGRILSYSEAGAPYGAPVFHFHGTPGSRLECWGGAESYRAAGARLVTADRPGIGRSSAQPGRALLDWPRDVAELADALGLRRFAAMGHSLGAAYAIACAYALPERVAAAAIVGGVPRLDQPGAVEKMGTARYWRAAGERPASMRAAYAGLAQALRFAPALGHWLFFRRASAPDRKAVKARKLRRRFRATVVEAARPGARGLVDDMRVVLKPWGFALADIPTEVLIWHGRDDDHVPAAVAEEHARTIARSELTMVENEGHFSLPERHAERIVRPLVARVSGQPVRERP